MPSDTNIQAAANALTSRAFDAWLRGDQVAFEEASREILRVRREAK